MASNEQPSTTELDAVIIGAGIAGLWTLDTLTKAGHRAVLIEKNAIAQGQTIWSQGILHSGLKYTLSGTLTGAAKAVRDLPERWASAMRGDDGPDLTRVRLRADHCLLWRTDTIASRLGMIGAKAGLKTKPIALDDHERPAVLRDCPGTVARLDEMVLCPRSLAEAFAHVSSGRILRSEHNPVFTLEPDGSVRTVTIDAEGRTLTLAPKTLVLTAGNGAAELREQLGLASTAMQVRPLRMTLVRGPLPLLNGHCVDGNKTRVTITSDTLGDGKSVWQIGGEVAEKGHSLTEAASIAHTRSELLACIPGLDLTGCEWSSYLAPRAEGRTPSGKRPEQPTVIREHNVITAWPSKLVAAPQTADLILQELGNPPSSEIFVPIETWPSPDVARLPWEHGHAWVADEQIAG